MNIRADIDEAVRVYEAYRNGELVEPGATKEQKCRGCGCTDNNACPGGCYWVEPDLCSRCAEKAK